MSKSIFSAPHFNNEAAAYAYVEAHLWSNGPVCPHCGVIDRAGRLQGKTNRPGLWKCYACRKPFTVKVGTIFEASHIAMRDWLTAIHLICSSKKGISANQLHRTMGVTLKSAWFMAHRIRLAFEPAPDAGQLGGAGKTVEADEMFIGQKAGKRKAEGSGGYAHKRAILALVERKGHVRSFPIESASRAEIKPPMQEHIARSIRTGRSITASCPPRCIQPSTTPRANMSAIPMTGRSTPTPSRASFRSSAAAWSGLTSIAAKPI